MLLIFIAEFAERRCSDEGKWEGKPGTAVVNNQGWTNYTNCYLPGVLKLLRQLGNETEVRVSVDVMMDLIHLEADNEVALMNIFRIFQLTFRCHAQKNHVKENESKSYLEAKAIWSLLTVTASCSNSNHQRQSMRFVLTLNVTQRIIFKRKNSYENATRKRACIDPLS